MGQTTGKETLVACGHMKLFTVEGWLLNMLVFQELKIVLLRQDMAVEMSERYSSYCKFRFWKHADPQAFW